MKNTPITKRIHMSAHKKNSPAKQTTDPIRVTSAAGEVLEASANITKGEKGKLPSYSEAWSQNLEGIKGKYKDFASYVSDMESIKKGSERYKQREQARAKAEERGRKPSVTFNYEPVNQDPTKGTTVDTSTAYGVRQISRGQKKAARDVRRAKIKLSKFAKQNDKGEWVANDGLNARQKAKFEERKSELESMKNTQKRIMAQAKAGVDPTITARFNFGTEMKEGTPGGPLIDKTGKYQTKYNFEQGIKNSLGIKNTNDRIRNSVFDNNNNSNTKTTIVDSVQDFLSDQRIKEKNASDSFTKAVKGTSSGTSMLFKKGCKMGGYGSKTYKK